MNRLNQKELLSHYHQVLQQKENPYFFKMKHIPVSYDITSSIETLWNIHNSAIQDNSVKINQPAQSLLDLKIDIAHKLYSDCIFCKHQCHVDRTKKAGYCKVTTPMIASEFLHHGEESVFTPSHTIFFSGCNFQCLFCQNNDISQQLKGLYLSSTKLAQRIEQNHTNNSLNVNWVGGDPTPNLHYLLKTIRQIQEPIPQIWNSNMYCSKETMKLLHGVIDVFLSDFKFGNNTCAQKLANIPHYFEVISRNHQIAANSGDVFIRHLVLPNHIDCCSKPILSWIAEHIPETPLHIMDQYYPSYKACHIPELNRRCSQKEIQDVNTFAQELHLQIVN